MSFFFYTFLTETSAALKSLMHEFKASNEIQDKNVIEHNAANKICGIRGENTVNLPSLLHVIKDIKYFFSIIIFKSMFLICK